MGSHRFSSVISSHWAYTKEIVLLYRISIASEISPEWATPLEWDIPPHMNKHLEGQGKSGVKRRIDLCQGLSGKVRETCKGQGRNSSCIFNFVN